MTPEEQQLMLQQILASRDQPTAPPPGMGQMGPPPSMPMPSANFGPDPNVPIPGQSPYQTMGAGTDPMDRAAELTKQKEAFRLQQLKNEQMRMQMATKALGSGQGVEGPLAQTGQNQDHGLVSAILGMLQGNR